jgi:hypothetical protein
MNNNPEERNLIRENENEIPAVQESFWNRLTPKDVLVISSDLFPSLILVGFIINAIVTTDKYCSDNFGLILKGMMFIYSAFIIKALIHTLIICIQSENSDFSKISLQTMDFLLNL